MGEGATMFRAEVTDWMTISKQGASESATFAMSDAHAMRVHESLCLVDDFASVRICHRFTSHAASSLSSSVASMVVLICGQAAAGLVHLLH